MRSVDEWIGATDDTAIPPRVKIRVFDRFNGCCAKCGLPIVGKLRPAFDHIIALVNGGANKESNIQLLCSECHGGKTRADVQIKAKTYKKRLSHLGLKNKHKIPGSKGSGLRRRMDGSVWKE